MGSSLFIPPQLATLVDAPPRGDQWLHETKFDGYRMECIKEADRVRLLSRRGNDWTARFPAIVAAARRLKPRRAILDGEAVALLEDGRSSFQALQQVLHTDPPGATVYYAFDLLRLEGEDLRGLPLEERKARLARLLGPSRPRGAGALRYSEHTTGNVEAALARACRDGLEGLIVKRRDLPYESGRTRSWLKVKCQNRQELVVIGFTEPKGRRSGIGSLILGFRDDDGVLRYAGRVGTGMDDAMLASLRAQLEPLRRATPPPSAAFPAPGPGSAGSSRSWWPKSALPSGPATEYSVILRSRDCGKTKRRARCGGRNRCRLPELP